MGKKSWHKAGEIFSVTVGENEFIFGRILFDTNKQYIKKNSGDEQFNYLGWFGKCHLIETYVGVLSALDHVDFGKVTIKSDFVPNIFFKQEKVTTVGHRTISPLEVTFPEVLSTYNSQIYYTTGELKIPIDLSWEEYEKIKVCPSFGSGYWDIVATLSISGRKDLIDPADVKDFYFKDSDLRLQPELRERLYGILGENPSQTYYEMALKHGFDLARLYE